MKFKAIWKDTFREITKSKMRFLAILTIILLGVSFYVGISATGPDMIATSDEYFKELELMDYRIQSTYGLTEEDIESLEDTDDFKVQGHYAYDFMLEDASTIRLYSLDPTNGQEMNKYHVLDGRLPENSGEIAIDHKKHLREGIKVGDTITLDTGDSAGDPDEHLQQESFEVVGLVNSPLFIEIESRGISSIGSGSLNAFGVILETDYTSDIFTEAYVKVNGSKEFEVFTDEYKDYVKQYLPELEQTLNDLEVRRDASIQDEIQAELDEGRAEIAEAEQELADAEADLEEARIEIDDGWKEFEEGKAELETETTDAKREIAENEQKLREGAQELKDNKEDILRQKKELEAEQAKLLENEKELENGIAQLEDGISQTREGKKQIDEGLSQITSGLNEIEEAKITLAKETEQAQKELNQAEKDLKAAEAELEGAPAKFEQARKEIEQGRAQLLAETKTNEDQINENEQQLLAGLEQFGIKREQLNSKTNELEAQRTALNNQKQEVTSEISKVKEDLQLTQEQIEQTEDESEKADLGTRLEELQIELAKLEAQLDALTQNTTELEVAISGLTELQNGFNEIDTARKVLAEETTKAQAELEQAEEELAKEESNYQENLPANQAEIKKGWQELEKGKQELQEETEVAKAEITANEQMLLQQKQELESKRASLNEQELESQLSELKEKQFQIVLGKKQINDGFTQIDEGLTLIKEKEQEIQTGFNEIEEAKETLAEETAKAQEELDQAETDLNEAETEYQDGLATFEEEQADALIEIADAKEELAEAEADLDKLAKPEYMHFDRTDNFGYSEFKDNADRLSVIAKVFPVFFFLIAIFISFTTMTRMVDEEREYIGIMKAMGYKDRYILIKFIVYAAIATVIGASLGLVIGYTLFPKLIFFAYSSLYNFPDVVLKQYTLYTVIALIFAFVSTVGASLLAVQYSLRHNAARLLQPKPPKKGSRIWLERIGFIWNRLSFNYKITFRNVFRYKSRMLMTILGIAGSTGLILTGFGISDSVGDIPDIQYSEVNQFQAYVALDPNGNSDQLEDYRTVSQEITSIDNNLFVLQQNVRVEKEGMITQDINFFIPEEPNRIGDFVRLADYQNLENIYDLDDSGAYITQKIAQLLEVEIGDKVEVLNADDQVWTIEVAGIVENYMAHFAYMTPAYYNEISGENFDRPDVQLIKYDTEQVNSDALGSQLLEEDTVVGIQYVEDIHDAFAGSIESLDLITQILVISAAALAFIVLYNLTNINVSERSRELSTIKVLGSHDFEVTTYIYRENIILTFLGILVGLGFGNILTKFIMGTMEVDMLVFGRNIYFLSYLYSSLLTIVFTLVVMVVIHFQLKKIDMVEALKGND